MFIYLIKGRKEGRKEGREEGRKEGRMEGRKGGRKDGRKEGRKEERKEARNEGRKEGSQDGEHHLFNISFMRGGTSTLRGKEHQETEDHDHELSPRLDRKENGTQFFPLPQGEKNLPKKRVDHPQGGLDWWAVCVFLWCVGNVEMID